MKNSAFLNQVVSLIKLFNHFSCYMKISDWKTVNCRSLAPKKTSRLLYLLHTARLKQTHSDDGGRNCSKELHTTKFSREQPKQQKGFVC